MRLMSWNSLSGALHLVDRTFAVWQQPLGTFAIFATLVRIVAEAMPTRVLRLADIEDATDEELEKAHEKIKRKSRKKTVRQM